MHTPYSLSRVTQNVIILTLVSLCLQSCMSIHTRESIADKATGLLTFNKEDYCKNHTHLKKDLAEFISKRFHRRTPVRMGLVPFSVPVNFATFSQNLPGFDFEIVRRLHAELLGYNEIPILEIANRKDWPGKKEEFFSGNFGALSFARQAGYDLILVGYVESPDKLGQLSAQMKVIEVESGITVYYGKSAVDLSEKNRFQNDGWWIFSRKRRPDTMFVSEQAEELSV